MAVFAFRGGRSIRGINAQEVGTELERIRAEKGTLTAEAVLEAAHDEASPLHAGFEWDDTEAARQHRLNQARRLIVSIRIIDSPVQVPVPAWVSVRTPEHGRSYVPTTEALTDEQLKARVLDQVRVFIEALELKFRNYEEVAAVLATLKKNVG